MTSSNHASRRQKSDDSSFVTSVICSLLLGVVGSGQLVAHADDLVIPFGSIEKTLVLIEVEAGGVHSFGVGVVVDSTQEGSSILTAAHVLVVAGASVTPTVNVYRPPNAVPIAQNVSVVAADVDTKLDLAVIHISIPNMPTSCLRAGAPRAGTPLGLAAFSVRTPDASPNQDVPFSRFATFTYPTVREGIVGGSNTTGTEFFAPIEKGYSGGPIFEERTGLVFAVTQKANQVDYQLSSSTFISISGIEFARFLDKHLTRVPLVSNSNDNYQSLQRNVHPDMSEAGRLILLTEGPSWALGANHSSSINDLVRSIIRNELDLADLFEEVGTSFHAQVDSKLNAIEDEGAQNRARRRAYQQACSTARTTGIIGAASLISQSDSAASITYQFSLSDCWGNIFAKSSTLPINLPPSEVYFYSHRAEWNQVNIEIVNALHKLTRDSSGLVTFAEYGLPLSDGERRAYFSLARDATGNVRASSVLTGGSAYSKGLRDNAIVAALNGYSADDLRRMSDDDLVKAAADAESSGKPIVVKTADGKTIKFTPFNYCGYLQLESLGVRDWPLAP